VREGRDGEPDTVGQEDGSRRKERMCGGRGGWILTPGGGGYQSEKVRNAGPKN
jgi:hypothetical protein